MTTTARPVRTGPGTATTPHPSFLLPGPRLRAATGLSVVLVLLMLAQSAAGLLVDGLYPEEAWAVAALRGNDLVTLVLVVPALVAALVSVRRRPTPAAVVTWLALVFYGVYNYAYYAFGAAFSDVFLLHVAALAVSLYALVLLGTSIDAEAVSRRLRRGPAARAVAVLTALVGLALIGAWGSMSVRFAATGELPADVMPPAAVHLVYALDLAVLAPAFVVSGVLLWRRRAWGAVLSAAVTASGAAYLVVLEVVGGFQADAGLAGKSWLSPVGIGAPLLLLVAALVLLVPGRDRSSADA